MALKRNFLTGMGLNDEQVSAIIEAHLETVNGLKDEIDTLNGKLEGLEDIQKELNDLKQSQGDNADWKGKYETVKTEYDTYKSNQEAAAALGLKKKAYMELLNEANIAETARNSIIDVTKFDDIALAKDGTIKNKDTVLENIKERWGGFVKQIEVSGAQVKNPKNDGGAVMTRQEIAKIQDTAERQAAYAKLLEAESKGE